MTSFPRPLSRKLPGPPPRNIHPISYPQKPLVYPSLPSPARPPHFARNWTRSTHLVPAALPRTTPDVPAPKLPPDVGSDRNERVSEITEMVVNARQEHNKHGPLEEERSRKPLWNCINRYVNHMPNKSGKSITLLCAHPNGLNKETWEPTIASLIERLHSDAPNSLSVDEIWTWEAVNHGESAVINDSNLGAVYDWSDNIRDILNFLVYHMPETPIQNDCLALHLNPVPEVIANSRRTNGFTSRTLVGVGHSFGGCTTALAACHMPVLFSGLVMVDPIIESVELYYTSPLPYGAIKRRWRWPSREDALRFFKANPFFNAWDPTVLNLYVEHGIRPSPDGNGVQLKMNGIQEATVFADYWTSNDAYGLLPALDPRIPIQWVLPDTQKTWFRPDVTGEHAQQRVWLRPENASNVILPGVGHLITQEAPDQLARELHAFLVSTYSRDDFHPTARL